MPDTEKPEACPFCGATPHQGLTPKQYCQLHGEPLQSYRVWCPHGCAQITEPTKREAVTRWKRRVPTTRVAALEAEVARLKALVETAFEEGFMEALGKPNRSGGPIPHGVAWQMSAARAALAGEG